MFAVNASYPTAVFRSPVVIASRAVVPTATLYSALLVVDEGSFPIYKELVSISASLNPVTFDAVPFASSCVWIADVTPST